MQVLNPTCLIPCALLCCSFHSSACYDGQAMFFAGSTPQQAIAASKGKSKDLQPPYNVVITGGTKGVLSPIIATFLNCNTAVSVLRHTFVILADLRVLYPGVGKALATEFLRAGDSVVICSRSGA